MQTNTLSTAKARKASQDLVGLCDFAQNPFLDCYCMTISSPNIYKMLDFCAGDYIHCPIYLKTKVKGGL